MYNWSESSRSKSDAKDGVNSRPVPVPFYCFCLRGPTQNRKEWAKISCFHFDVTNNIVVL